ncbi:MAG: class I SAM-dependent methyltransferase [Holophagaceae bacterium]|jgi:2-polyprenyl-3-methyl-5-hydroxy-6-metoxy-1,4-benzoquinol methylase
MSTNEVYLDWKSWNPDTFGYCTAKESRRFSLELQSLNLKPPVRILEIGFGHGHFMAWAKSQAYEIHGIEQNPRLVELALQKGYSARITDDQADYGSEQYDLIVAWDVLEHLSHTEIGICLAHVRKALVRGGHFLAKCPNGDSPLGLSHHNGDVTHQTSIGYHKWTYFARQAQLDIVTIRGTKKVILYPNPIITLLKTVNWVLRKVAQWVYGKLFLPHYKNDYFSADTVVIFTKN